MLPITNFPSFANAEVEIEESAIVLIAKTEERESSFLWKLIS